MFKTDIETPCAINSVPPKTYLMPSKQSQGNIPLMAMVTGDADSLECVLRKMGIDDSEFTDPAGGGRVQFYLGNDKTGTGGKSGQKIDAATPAQSVLFGQDAQNQPVINAYDMTILACQGGPFEQSAADQATLRQYAASGGRVFTTHYSYTWLTNNDPPMSVAGKTDNWSEVAKWNVDEKDRADNAVGIIDLTSNPKGKAFQGWLEAVGASPGKAGTPGTTDVIVIRHDADAISSTAGQTQQWLYRNGTNNKKCTVTAGTCTSNTDCTPKVCNVNTALGCTANADCNPGGTKVCQNKPGFPACSTSADCGGTNSCVSQTCKANTCNGNSYLNQSLPLHFTFNTPVNLSQDLTTDPPTLQCGRVLFSDFHVQNANENGLTFPAQCDTQPMNPQEKLLEFMIFDLGSCVPPAKECVPAVKCPAGQDCGYAPDGCGGLLSCGACASGEECGVGNPRVANKCGKGTQTCAPTTCAAQHVECGPAADGCGAKIDTCGSCAAGELCVAGRCAHVN